MKHHAFLAAAFAALAVVGFSGSRALGADPAKPIEKSTATRAVPFANYWDAKSWDRSGGALFWHKQTEEPPTAKRVKENPRAAKSARSTTPLSHR